MSQIETDAISPVDTSRREQILAAAEQQVLARNGLGISLSEIADELNVSRSLIYVYFESVAEIIDELFARRAQGLAVRVEELHAREPDFRRRALALYRDYLEHLIDRGQLGSLVLQERNQDSPLGTRSTALFRSILLRLARDIARNLKLAPRAAFVVIELLGAIPESLARQVRSGSLERKVAFETVDRLVGAALDAMAVKPAGEA